MKNILFLLGGALLLGNNAFAQRQCGIEAERAAMIAKDPSWKDRFDAQKAGLQSIANNYKQLAIPGAAERSTNVISPVPVIFHVIVTTSQLAQMGGVAGVQQRCDSQIAVLNRDYNRENPDSVHIPSGWKHLYANVGVHFGLAHTMPSGMGSPGYELSIIPDAVGGFSNHGSNNDYSDAKYAISNGLDAWDNTKYMNVWCINFADNSGLLGITTPLSFTTGSAPIPLPEMGICINYLALGKRASSTDNYIATGYGSDYYDMGRTLTHEVGHFFEIWHTWGDDGGACPWNGGSDDGLADTPPESDHKYFAYPDTITTGCGTLTLPCGTYYDPCRYDGAIDTQQTLHGISSHDYLNYVDDIAMFMFTTDQAAAMAAMVLVPPGAGHGADSQGNTGETYSLTQNPILLTWPANAAVSQVDVNNSLTISPNPTTGIVNIAYNSATDELMSISVVNMLGQEMKKITTTGLNQDYYSIDLSAMSKGIYFVRCNFASGSVTRKILVQ